MKYIAVVTTVGNLDEARTMARALVERKLAACAHIHKLESFYHWQGELQNEVEYSVLFKTVAERYPSVEAAIRELHSYQLPAIYVYAFEQLYAPYGVWIESNSVGEQ